MRRQIPCGFSFNSVFADYVIKLPQGLYIQPKLPWIGGSSGTPDGFSLSSTAIRTIVSLKSSLMSSSQKTMQFEVKTNSGGSHALLALVSRERVLLESNPQK